MIAKLVDHEESAGHLQQILGNRDIIEATTCQHSQEAYLILDKFKERYNSDIEVCLFTITIITMDLHILKMNW